MDNEEKELNTTEENETQKDVEGLQEGIVAGIIPTEFGQQIRDSFLDYAVSTLTARSVPDARDGLKPVQRRIIYAMTEMGVTPDKPFKKSARVEGEVMGKYHPHGNSSIYLAMCRLAQPFAMRYTLVQGHGNFGSPDGDEPAADRYTEVRLSKIALELTRDIDKDTVPFMDTYDNEGQEPVVLPARFPNFLCNETSGIAVGMATSVPPHNLRETIDACIAVIRNPEITTTELMDIIKGPDFPDGAMIMGRSGIKRYFETGHGSIKIRAKYKIEEHKDKQDIVFYEFPYMVNKRELAKKIVELSDNKTIEGIASVADYSSGKTGTRFVITLKKGAIPELVLNHLYKYTSLQSTFAVNMLALDNGTPKVLTMKQALEIYINFQEEVITNRTNYNLKKALDRIHILEGIITIADAIDETISIIRSSQTNEEATERLIARFNLDEVQCKSILDMQLRKLTGLERQKYLDERDHLNSLVSNWREILSNRKMLEETLISELEEIKNKYGDDRRTEISDYDVDTNDEDLIPSKETLIILTRSGYIKRIDPSEFRTQNRGGVGIQGMKTKQDDDVEILVHSKTKTDVLFFTNLGRVYRTRGYTIQEGSRTSKGIPAVNFLRLMDGEKINAIISTDDYNDEDYLFFATKNGIVKRCHITDFKRINVNGKIAIGLKDDDELLDVKKTNGSALVSLGSSEGKVCTFREGEVRAMGRTAAGVKGINLSEGSKVIGVVTSLEGNKIFSLSSNGYGKITDGTEYRITSRGSKGVLSMKSSEKNGTLIAIKTVKGDEDIIIITDHGTTIKTSLTQVSELSRNTIGVKIIKLRENERISSCCIEPSESEYEPIDFSQDEEVKAPETDDDAGLAELLRRAASDGSIEDDSDEE